MDALRDYAIAKTGKSLPDLIEKHEHHLTGSSHFSVALRALTLGPLGFDVDLVHKALAGFGANEMLLTELILGRSGDEIRLLIEGFRLRYGKDLVSAAKHHLSGKNERSMCFFNFVLDLKKKLMFFFIGSVHHGFEWTTSS